MFVATINKTLESYIFAIVGAEYILRWLPIGTHEWDRFVEPSKLIDIAKEHGLKLDKLDGIKFNILINEWKLSEDKSVNYIVMFKKI
jgi:2-polyprenyl-6-hydroxyphenyl methylase/3-demethylubiquinone-9 3-methyltransferase